MANPNELKQEISDRTKAWANGEDANLQKIEQNGKLGLWDMVSSWPIQKARELWIEGVEGNGDSGNSQYDQRQAALKAATARAQQVYQINQQNQNLPPGQSPQPTPTPVSAWTLLNQGQ